jgi:hypothetical protein
VHFVALWLTLQEGLIPSKGSSLASSAHSMRIPVGCRIRPVAYWDAINSTIMLMHWQTSGSQSCCCSGVFLHPCNNCCAWQRMRHAGGHHLAHRLHTHVRGGSAGSAAHGATCACDCVHWAATGTCMGWRRQGPWGSGVGCDGCLWLPGWHKSRHRTCTCCWLARLTASCSIPVFVTTPSCQ